MTHPTWIRIALGYVAIVALQVGVWAQFAPRSFYDDFPGLGRTWVSVDGPYNEHLVRDVGGLYLALAVLVIAAAVTLRREMIAVAAGAVAVSGVPHFVYHVVNTDGLAAGDITASLAGLALFAALPLVVVVVSRRALT